MERANLLAASQIEAVVAAARESDKAADDLVSWIEAVQDYVRSAENAIEGLGAGHEKLELHAQRLEDLVKKLTSK